jgi:hypothetical protein
MIEALKEKFIQITGVYSGVDEGVLEFLHAIIY